MKVKVEFDGQEYGQSATIELENADEVEMFWEIIDLDWKSLEGFTDKEQKFQHELLTGNKS